MLIAAALLLIQPASAPVIPPVGWLPLNARISVVSLQTLPSSVSPAATETDAPSISSEVTQPAGASFLPGMLEKTPTSSARSVKEAAADPAPQPIMLAPPKPSGVARVSMKRWWALSAAMHGAAAFDAYSTRRFVQNGTGHELNPIFAPFAGSPAIYAGTQFVPVVLDIVSRKMMHSEHPMLRRFWWIPQSFAAGSSIICAAHNMSLH